MGLEPGRFCKLCKEVSLRVKSADDKEFSRLVDVLFLHGFLLSRDAF